MLFACRVCVRFCCFTVFASAKTPHVHAEQMMPPDRAARTENIMEQMISSAKTTWTRVFFYLILFLVAGILSSLMSGALLPVEFMQSVQAAQTTQTAQTAQEVFPGEYQYPDEYPEENPVEYPGGDSGRITVLDYGNARMEGDAVLVESNGHFILMDTGYTDNRKDVGNSKVIRYLKSRGIHDLDLYLSHYHNDHYYLMTTIMRDEFFTVDTVYLPNVEDLLEFSSSENKDAKWYKDLTRSISKDGNCWGRHSYPEIQETIKDKNLKSVILHKGDSFMVGDALFEVIWQEENIEKPTPDEPKALKVINDSSLVTRVTIGGIRYLTGGDISKSVEQNMIDAGVDLQADIVKTNHHSNEDTSNLPEFYQTVGAAWAFGTGGGTEVCRKATEEAGTNYINMKNNGQILFDINRGEITMHAESNLRRINRLYRDAHGKERIKTFWFDKYEKYFFTERMIPEGCSYSGWGWHMIGGRMYYYDREGNPFCGIMEINGTRYRFDEKGMLVHADA